MVTPAELTSAAGELATAGRVMDSIATRIDDRRQRLDRVATNSVEWWVGGRSVSFRTGNTEFVATVANVGTTSAEATAEIRLIGRVAGELATRLRRVEAHHSDAVGLLRRIRLDLDRLWSTPADEQRAAAKVVRLEREREDIVVQWITASSGAARRLSYVASTLPLPNPADLGGPAGFLLPYLTGSYSYADAAGVATWWPSLTPAERSAVIATTPSIIGNLDGVPFGARADANAAVMQATLDASEPGSPLWTTLQQFVGPDGAIDPTRRFVVFDPAGDGKIAEVFGDVSTAEHIAVMVPGMGSTMAGFNDLSGRGRRLHASAGGDTAVIAWTGYDTPQGLALTPDVFEVVSGDQAEVGGRLLHGFVDGIRSQSGAPVTLIGHSYGSVTVGKALHDGVQVERVVFMGSPGVDADHVDEFPPGAADEFFASEIKGDIVANLEHFGENPTDPDFGATVFDSGDADGLTPISRHGEYYDDGVAIENLAAIVTGGEPTPGRTDVIEYVTEPIEDIDQAFHDSIDRIQEFDIPVIDDRYVDGPIDAVQSASETVSQGREIIVEEFGHFGQDAVEWGTGQVRDAVEWGVVELDDAWERGVDEVTGWFS